MNVFEDLIGELKDENLLEDTVIEVKNNGLIQADGNGQTGVDDVTRAFGSIGSSKLGNEDDAQDFESNSDMVPASELTQPADDREFFRKRAIEEVSSLQMVEHVLAGVEREHMKVQTSPYDDLEVKKALHKFLQVSDDPGSEGRSDAEYTLLQETQDWHSALSSRDKNVSVANLRRFCEDSRPVLSAQALMALARFYRNSPFTEAVRGKFDFVMTRLFSREIGVRQRQLLFSRAEMIGHIKTLYGNWSSITYHSAEDHQTDIDLAIERFDGLIRNFEVIELFEELLDADVFQTIRSYKEHCSELFYVPEVTAAAIDCNVRLGNKYVELILEERRRHGIASLEEKYGFTYDQAVSNATGKTLLLVELLNEKPEEVKPDGENRQFEQESFDLRRSAAVRSFDVQTKKRSRVFGLNRWLVVVTILISIASGGAYLWADKFAGSDSKVVLATELDLGGTDLKSYLQTVRVSNETAYGLTQPSWETLGEGEQKEFLRKVLSFAQSKGIKRVNLLNNKGRTVAFASANRLEVYKQS